MKLNEFLLVHDLQLRLFVCSDGSFRCDFKQLVEISNGLTLTSACGESSKDIKTAIQNTLERISNKKLKIDNKKYIRVLDVEL